MKKTVLIVIRVVCIVGFLVCVGVLGWYWHSDRSDRAVAEALAAAPIGRAVHRAGDKALHVADLAQCHSCHPKGQ